MSYLTDIGAACSEIKKKLDIAKVVEDDLGQPSKSGSTNNFYYCPFHSETKNPSFGVHKQMQIYHCFGCGASGDAIGWVQNFHGVSVPEAINRLAETYHIDMSGFYRNPTPEEIERNRYISICEEACRYFSKSLLSDKDLLSWYLTDTGFDVDHIVTYDVGYSPSVAGLVQHLFSSDKTITQDDIDRLEFNNRRQWSNALVYPVRNHLGQICRFYTKPMDAEEEGGKYLGTSSKHPLFTHKLIYGFNVARKNIRRNGGSLRIGEGFKAAIASNGGAVMGVSVHDEQIKLMQEHGIREVKVAFDGDAAGRAASVGILDELNRYGSIKVLISKLPDGKQPDSIRKEFGQDALDLIYNMAMLPIQFFVDLRRDQKGELSLENKFSLIHDLKKHLSSIPEVQLDLTSKYLADVLGVEQGSIKEFVFDAKIGDTNLFNRDAELTVLQTSISNNRVWSTIKQVVPDATVFTTSANQYLYKSIDSAHQKARDNGVADSVTVQVVRDEIKILYQHMPEMAKMVDHVLSTQSKYDFVDALQKIVDLHRRRQGIEQARHLQSMLHDLDKTTIEVMSKYRRNMVSSLDVRREDTSTPANLADVVRRELEARSLRKSAIIGCDFTLLRDVDGKDITCLPGLALAMGGLQKGHQIVLSAYTGVGKSMLALQIATSISVCPHTAEQIPVLWVPLEMTPEEITMRQISFLSGINNSKVQTGMFNREEQAKVNKALDLLATSQFYCKKPRSGTIDETFALIDEYHFKYGIMGTFVDYIQLVAAGESDRGVSREQVIGRASKLLKNQVAEGLGIFSFCIAQQNKQNYTAGETGKVENIGGSYQIAQDADDVLLLAEKTPEQMAEAKNGANRRGFLDKRRGGTSDLMFDFDVDLNKHVSLRWTECINTGQMLGLSRGTS